MKKYFCDTCGVETSERWLTELEIGQKISLELCGKCFTELCATFEEVIQELKERSKADQLKPE